MDYFELNEIYQRAKKIVASDLDWKVKYDMIFSDEVSGKFTFEWYDPDMDYQDDVLAFMSALDAHYEEQLTIFNTIDN